MSAASVFPLAVLACTIHELGHFAAIWKFKGRVRYVKFSVVGAEIRLNTALGYIPEGIIALAGPGINLCFALLSVHLDISYVFADANLALGCFNLLPIRGLDGCRALYCILALLLGTEAAEKIQETVSHIVFTIFSFWGVYIWGISGNISILFIVIWLIIGEIGKKDGFRSCHKRRKGLK